MNRWLFTLCCVLLIGACKEAKKQLSDDNASVEITDFIEFFPESKLPLQVADTTLARKSSDSLRIGNKVFGRFVPDSLLAKGFGKSAKPRLFPIGRTAVKDGETYLFLKAEQGTKKIAYVLVFDEKQQFVTGMNFLQVNGSPQAAERSYFNMDSKYTLTTLQQRSLKDGQVVYNKNVYIYNTAGVFTLILTESNDQAKASKQLINPIDTLPGKHKWAGDYWQDKKNLVSFRDGRNPNTLQVFVHFEKDGGNCNGELKGEVKFVGKDQARFTESGSPCVIDFNFSGNTVRMKEQEGCGSYRDIKCFFDGAYTRKKVAAPRKKKK